MNRIQVRYRRRSDTCAECKQPIDRDPTTDGNLYGWRPTCRVCYPCWCISLFGHPDGPDEVWWRKVRRLTQAAWGFSEYVAGNGPIPDLDF